MESATLPGFDMRTRLSVLRTGIPPRVKEFKRGFHYFRKSFVAMLGLGIIGTFAFIAIFAPFIAPPEPGTTDPYRMKIHFDQQWFPPSAEHPFGQTYLGMDIFYGVIWGSRLSITIGLSVVILSVLAGAFFGLVAGYYGRWIDEALMRITDVFFGIPSLILAMAVVIALGQSLSNLIMALAIVSWPTYARLVRGVALSVKTNLYVEAARATGTRSARILFRHIFPNTLSPILVQATLDIGSVVLTAAGLSFIGFNFATETTAEWGRMVAEGQQQFGARPDQWWPVFYPGIFIFLFVLGFNMLGDGLRDVLDPRLRR